jgi:hypothetical protein
LALTGFSESKRAKNTQNNSDAILGCLSPRDFKRTGVREGREAAYAFGECIEKTMRGRRGM